MKLSLVLTSLLTFPLLATPLKLPSAKIRMAVGKAIRAGDAKVLATVLDEHGLQVDSVLRAGGYTVLHDAVVEGPPKLVEYLLTHGAEVNVANEYGDTPLDEATAFAKQETIALLQQAGATQGEGFRIKAAPTATGGHTPANTLNSELHTAAEYGNTETVELLIERGANIEATDIWGQTPLMIAALSGNTETVELLLDRGANIEAKDNMGRTPLHLAALCGNTETVELLLNRGANIEAKDNEGWTPLLLAALSGNTLLLVTLSGNTETVELLIKHGANIEAKDNEGHTPLHLAALYGNTETVELLLDRGANIEAKNNEGKTALMIVAESEKTESEKTESEKTETVEMLIKHGAKH